MVTLSQWNFASRDQMKGWDVDFVVADKHFYAHRTVLSMVSEYFDGSFNGVWRDKNKGQEIPLDEVEPDVFEAFLHCVYPCGCELRQVPEDLLVPLVIFADRCLVTALVDKCHKALETANGISGIDKLNAAYYTNGKDLEKRVVESLSLAEIEELNKSQLMQEWLKAGNPVLQSLIARTTELARHAQRRYEVAKRAGPGMAEASDWGASGGAW
ncbi:Speckle-type POZ protein-like protein [Aphelenchoides avenae]|nr:Speckle-type POZ protein-like protein [Aphelenchus avenae]